MMIRGPRPNALVFLCLACATAQAQSTAQPGPIIRAEARVVLVDAVVTGKKGEYLHDLTARNFHIWQDGKEQVVASASLGSQTKSDPRFLVLFFDDTQMAALDQLAARQAVSRFIDANAAPGRLMAIVSYNGSLRVAQNFTDNAARLKDALNRAEASSRVTTTSRLERPLTTDAPGAESFGSRGMLQALGNLAGQLGVLPGRKTVVLLTGGLTATSQLKPLVTAAVEAAGKSDVAIYPANVLPVAVDLDQSSPVAQLPRARPGRGAAEDPTPATQDPAAGQPLLQALADGTGGFLLRDAGELRAGLQRVGEEQSEHYVLSYAPPESKEGSCHALKVKVDRGGAVVRARSSYCSTNPVDLIAGTSAAKDLENRASGADPGDLKASVELPYFYSSPGVARVHLTMDIDLGSLKFENQKGKLHGEVNLLGIANTPDGAVGARFSDTLKFDFDNQAEIEQWRQQPVHYEKEFKIAPGKYSLALAFGSGGASFGKLESPLVVEPWSGAELALSGVALSRETHSAADLGLLSSLVEDRTALIAEGTQFVPSGSHQFAKTGMGYFYLEVYDPDPASVSVRVRVLDRGSGALQWDSGSTRLPASSAGKSSVAAGASLQVNTLAAGSYQLEITAIDAAGKQVKRTADFQVK